MVDLQQVMQSLLNEHSVGVKGHRTDTTLAIQQVSVNRDLNTIVPIVIG